MGVEVNKVQIQPKERIVSCGRMNSLIWLQRGSNCAKSFELISAHRRFQINKEQIQPREKCEFWSGSDGSPVARGCQEVFSIGYSYSN